MAREKASAVSSVFLALVTILVMVAAVYGAATKNLYVSTAGVNSATCGTSTSNPCKTINYTLQYRATPNTNLILAPGTYNENVLINRDKNLIALIGDGPGVCKITAPSTTTGAVEVHGVQVALKGLAISGGGPGLFAGEASVKVQQCTILNGIGAESSNLQLEGVTVKNTKGPGIGMSNNSTAFLARCNLSGSAGPALFVRQNSSVNLDTCTISGNNTSLSGALGAINLVANSSVNLMGNTITSNKASGISLQSGSIAQLMGGNKVMNNGTATTLTSNFRCGISIAFSSHVDLNPWPPGTTKDQISGNYGPGIWMTSKGDLMVMGAVINGNHGDGVELHGNSTANFTSGATITYNTGYGIACYDTANDSKYMGSPGTNTNNTKGPTKCFRY